MNMMMGSRLGVAALIALALSSCTTTTQASFEKNPKGVPKVSLCRTYLESRDPVFQQQIVEELARRGITPYECPLMVQRQNQAGAVLAAVAIGGAAVAYCANHNCGGSGGYYQPPAAYPGNCQYNHQRAADGSRCGDRSAASRPGGWN
ncbi:hypothetical protein [Pseudorhizobium pelagicum]|uniref:Lipoprotein n=1 Tax=Pseudorhizobium pelagicum TaxID=1509405 RepID=A0A922P2L1_9HYPH|nr:hypothetical protein [Pseudorhizobium pelagicum]KEQ07019.1 hypothetical protein GV67_22550 [Pseudorhizobium pelagicum]KEQ09964.1 hypothetical protein GV68_18340 [Pseudorhizobium pelagicum]